MIVVGISDISKNPALIDKFDDIVQIINKKTKKVKGVFIPKEYLDQFQDIFNEIEYKKFVKRNALLSEDLEEDNTLLDGLQDDY